MTSTENRPAITEVRCPTCKQIVAWVSENKFRPFCSERCQLIDFGDWAAERNAIPVVEPPDFGDEE